MSSKRLTILPIFNAGTWYFFITYISNLALTLRQPQAIIEVKTHSVPRTRNRRGTGLEHNTLRAKAEALSIMSSGPNS